MGTLILLQVALNLAFIATITVLWIDRTRSKTQDNPRLSRGLQLLSSKIAVLQDLMDKSETIGKHLSQLIEAKQTDVQETLEEVERHLYRVSESIEKSKDVARLFRDKIPHEEIIERQNSAKYIKAAKLAHQGLSSQDISTQVDIPMGELELIVKLNKQNLMVNSNQSWLEDEDIKESRVIEHEGFTPAGETANQYSRLAEAVKTANSIPETSAIQTTAPQTAPSAPPASVATATNTKTMIYSSRRIGGVDQESSTVRPVIFKKITSENRFP